MSDAAPPFRVRCPADDGSRAHTSVDLRAPISLDDLSRALRALKRCACGLYLIACVDLVGGRPVVALYVAGKAREQYDRNRHRCPL